MGDFAKHWTIFLGTIIIVASLVAISAASIFHADLATVGQMVFIAGAGLAFLRNYITQEEQIRKIEETARGLAEKLKSTEEALSKKVSEEARVVSNKVLSEAVNVANKVVVTAQVLAKKTEEQFQSVTEGQQEIKDVVTEIKVPMEVKIINPEPIPVVEVPPKK